MNNDLRSLLHHNAVLTLILEFLAPPLRSNTFHRCSALGNESLVSDLCFRASHSAGASKDDYLAALSTHRYVPNVSEELFQYQQRLTKIHRSERNSVTEAQFAASLRSKWRPRVAMWDVLALSMTCRSICGDISNNIFWKERLLAVVCPSDATIDVESVTVALTSWVFSSMQLAETSEGVSTMCQAWKALYIHALREYFFVEHVGGSRSSSRHTQSTVASEGPLSSLWQELKGLMSLRRSGQREYCGADFLCHEARNKLVLVYSPIPSDSLFEAVDLMRCFKGSCLDIPLDASDVSTTRIFVGGLQNAVPIAFVSGIPMNTTTPSFLAADERLSTRVVDMVTLDICRTQRPEDILGPHLDAAVVLINLCWLPLTNVVSQWLKRRNEKLTRRDLCDSSREWSRILEMLCDCHYLVQQTHNDRPATTMLLLYGCEQRLSLDITVMRLFLKEVLIPIVDDDRKRFVATAVGFEHRVADETAAATDWVIACCSLSFPSSLRNAIALACC